ncbi:MAG: isopentenyl phosphate kinase family protein [Thermoflexales bacterium]|nr:isopentenyl phosphate kinase family protein [Thermoflexales bacterium]
MRFLKLGGSLITDKTRDNTPRPKVLQRVCAEVARGLAQAPGPLVLGHGSGSFGHTAARRYGTRGGVHDAAGWRGFAEVSVMAARLNRIVADALHEAGVPVIVFAPSASARCRDGVLVDLDTGPLQVALKQGLVPLVMGDVAIDSQRGGTIVSTEEVFAHLVATLHPQRILLAGETEGVYADFGRPNQHIVPVITPANWEALRSGVGGSRGADVTGGMASKVADMLALCRAHPGLEAVIFSGLVPGTVERALAGQTPGSTLRGG